MDKIEWNAYLGEIFPPEIMGFKRPIEPVPTDLDFSTEFPQFIPKDPVVFTLVNAFLRQLLSNDSLNKQWVDMLFKQMTEQDFKVVTETIKGLMTPEMLKKLNGIAVNANNYTHPTTHPATMITQDATHRFATDTEKGVWNSKASTAVVTQTANGLASAADKKKLDSIAANATAYTHPNSHPASIITQDSARRMVSDAQISAWNAKANLASPGLTGTPTAPTPATADNSTKIATTAFVKSGLATVTAKNSVIVVTGVVGHGGTIPLPAGYAEAQCKWILNVDNRQVDDDDTIQCFTSAAVLNRSLPGRVATNHTGQRGGRTSNYIIIGVK